MVISKFFVAILFVATAYAATIGQSPRPLSPHQLTRGLGKNAERPRSSGGGPGGLPNLAGLHLDLPVRP